MATALIADPDKGLGLETARRLIAAGHTVFLGSRDPEQDRSAAEETGGRAVQLDVTSDASVRDTANTIADQTGHLDVLVNNAGITGPLQPHTRDTHPIGIGLRRFVSELSRASAHAC
ncbi:hypothetical protein CDO52_26030 [Nocardiopsis gilva YIM 90087]|uniref:Short-chain dehydrogenase n=1 Tax=Nocardiopsis gilva YIM 90087 TaxID=1235441 RepID=A0A223SCC1_9ACTN|nr:SDR family NAD(P)-dependent oxidoreductase [Nocardiopsis gilva]ASU85798.1 hypothetical protein CDO52_26030 [Nocardiopsis gilva YIM 90087]